MADTQNVTEALADLTTGTVRTLAAICRQLIEARVLNEDLLHSTLRDVTIALQKENVSNIGTLIPVTLSAALMQSSEKQP